MDLLGELLYESILLESCLVSGVFNKLVSRDQVFIVLVNLDLKTLDGVAATSTEMLVLTPVTILLQEMLHLLEL
jgi:hypothetical protein